MSIEEPIDPVKRLTQRSEAWGLLLDTRLLLSVAVSALVPVASIAWSLVVPVGWWLALTAFCSVFILCAVLTAVTVWVPRFGKFVEKIAVKARNRVASSPDLHGDLLDGLWLPQSLRLASWVSLALLLVLGGFVAGRWAPKTLRQQAYEAVQAMAKDQSNPVGAEAARQRALRYEGKEFDGPVIVATGNPNQSPKASNQPPPGLTPPMTNSVVTSSTNGPSNGPPPIVYYDPMYDPTKDARARGRGLGAGTNVVESRKSILENSWRDGGLWLHGPLGWLAMPVMAMNNLFRFGFGDPSEHRLRVVTVTQRVVEQQKLTDAELDALLTGVPPDKAEAFGAELKKIVKEGQGKNQALLDANFKVIDEAVARYKAKSPPDAPDNEVDSLAGMIIEYAKQNPPAAPGEVQNALKARLEGGKFLNPDVRKAVMDRVRGELDPAVFAGYEKIIKEID